MRYKCLAEDVYCCKDYCLLPLRAEDLLLIKEWRNAQMDYLRQKYPLSDDDQHRYYQEVVSHSFAADRPGLMLFSFLHGESCIGYGGLTNLSWDDARAEVSFLVNPERAAGHEQYYRDFHAFFSLLKIIAFRELQLNRLFTETYDLRPRHVAILEESGFRVEGRLKQHVFINNRYVDSLLHGLLRNT